jgi:TP901 family phage tail tape measure protein
MIPMSLGALAVSIYVDHTGIDTGTRTAIGKLEQFGRTLQQRGLSQFFIGVTIAIPLARAIQETATFDKQMRYISTVTKDAQKYMGGFTESIKDMSLEFGESTTTLTKGLYDILSSQIDAAHATDVLRVAVKAAVGGMTDTSVAADATVAVLNSYRLSASKAEAVSDWLFKIVELGTITYEELASRIGYVAPTAYAAGVSLEDLGAAIATVTHVGLPASTSIIAIANILQKFLKPSREAAALARQLGFEMNTATLKAWGMRGVFEKLAGLDPEIIAKLFPNIRGLRGAIPAIQAIKEYGVWMDEIADSTGAADRAFKRLTENNPLWLLLSRLGQSVIAISRAIGNALAPELLSLSSYFLNATRGIIEFVNNNRWIVVVLAAVSAAMMTSGISLITLGLTLRVVSLSLRSVGRMFAVVAVIGRLFGRAMGVVSGSIHIVSGSFHLLSVALVAPLIALGAFVGGLYALGRAFRLWAILPGGTFMEKLDSLGKLIKAIMLPAIEKLQVAFWNLLTWLAPVWQGIKGVVSAAMNAMLEMVELGLSQIVGLFGSAGNTISTIWGDLFQWVNDVILTIFPHGRDSLVEDLKYLELSFKHWSTSGQLAVVSWAAAFVGAFEEVKYAITSFIPKLNFLLKLYQASQNFEGRPIARIKAIQEAMSALVAVPERIPGELETGLKLRMAELEKELGGKFAADLLAPDHGEGPKIPWLDNLVEMAKVGFEKWQPSDIDSDNTSMGLERPSLAKMAERGSAEAYSIITQQDPIAETAKNTENMVKEQKITNRVLERFNEQKWWYNDISTILDLNLDT